MLVIPEEPEINHIVVIVGAHEEKAYSEYWYHGVYVLKKGASGKWVGSNPGASLEYQVEVDASHSDRIDIVVKYKEDERCRTVVTRKEGPLFVGVDSSRVYSKKSVAVVVISESEKDVLPFNDGESAYLVIRYNGATVLRRIAASDEDLRAYELPWGAGLGLELENVVEVIVRREKSGIRVTWPDHEARLWNANGNWVGVDHEWKRGLMGGKRKIKQSLIWMIPDPLWTPNGYDF